MSVYRYDKNSAVNEIVIRRSAGGGARAFLFAEDNITLDCVSGIKDALGSDQYHCVATQLDNRPCLEVRSLRGIDALEDTLRKTGFISGSRVEIDTQDAKFTVKEWLRSNMLLISGILNVIADIGFIGYGHLKQKLQPGKKLWEDRAAGIAYSTGSVMFTAFGRGDKSDHNARDISARLREKMLLDGLTVHDEGAVKSFSETTGGPAHRFYNFLHKHPSELGNASYAVAGGFLAKSALKSGDPKTKIVDGVLGGATMLSGATAALVKERAPDPNAPEPTDAAGKALRWVRMRPNRIAGFGYMVSSFAHGTETVRHLLSAKRDYQNPKDVKIAYAAYGLRGLFTAMNLVAEGVLTLASKGNGSGVKSDQSIEETTFAIVADAINRQPLDLHDKLITEYSRNFLARHDVMGGDPKVIEQTLRLRVENLGRNPWSKTAESTVAPEQAAQPITITPAAPNWQEKIGLQQATPGQLNPMSV